MLSIVIPLKKEKKEQNKQLYPFQENFQGILLLMSLDLLPMKAINWRYGYNISMEHHFIAITYFARHEKKDKKKAIPKSGGFL